MTSYSTAASSIQPDAEMISTFFNTTMDKLEGWVAVRAFSEKGAPNQTPRLTFHPLAGDAAELLMKDAEIAAQKGLATFVVPGAVRDAGSAKAEDVIAVKTIIVDLDHGAIQEKRDHLVRHLGHPSLEVASGGVTEDGEERLHLYWSLASPALGTEVARACELRHLVAQKVGGDPSFRSAHQPVRLPGSVYRKGGAERLVTVLADPGTSYDLGEIEARCRAMPSLVAPPEPKGGPRQVVGEIMVGHFREAGQDGITRFDALSTVIGYWIRRHADGYLSWDAAVREIVDYNQACILPPWSVDRLHNEIDRLRQRDLAAQAAKATLVRDADGDVVALPNSQDGLAVAFSEVHSRCWRYVTQWGQWLQWNGSHWERDRRQAVRHAIRLVCREHAAEREKPGLASASVVSAVETLARADPRHAADPDGWDHDAWALNTPAGLLDLKTGGLAAPTPEAAVTKITTAAPTGECPLWHDFLMTISGRDQELAGYLKRVAGYCLTGVTTEHALFFLYGTGANGKSVFVNTLSAVLGDYATIASLQVAVVRRPRHYRHAVERSPLFRSQGGTEAVVNAPARKVAAAAAPVIRKRRCAVYTRKSSEEGLDMEFNSLDAQRDACEAYAASQRAEGWLLLPVSYDDGGFSGGSLDRPALKRLLADIETGLVDVVVVYKIDRLSRSLTDFARLVEVFDRKGVTFVSVTQSFNTTTSMGRLTLNILLSFAQFEREVIGERIRDKFAASRRKGMWMGGNVPFGYRVENRKLLIEESEAAVARMIFERFVKTGSATVLARALHAEGVATRSGKRFDKAVLYKLLSNRVYVGDAVHKGTAYPGEHQPIIDRSLWDKVHTILAESPRKRAAHNRRQTPALLKGLIFAENGRAMTPMHTRKGDRLYRYYVTTSVNTIGPETCPVQRVPAGQIEAVVIDQLRAIFRAPEMVVKTFFAARGQEPTISEAEVREALVALDPLWDELFPAEQARIVQLLVERVDLTDSSAAIRIRTEGFESLLIELNSPISRRAA